jgi:hypothetical protein
MGSARRARDSLRRDGLLEVLGEDNLAPTVDGALQAIQAARQATAGAR